MTIEMKMTFDCDNDEAKLARFVNDVEQSGGVVEEHHFKNERAVVVASVDDWEAMLRFQQALEMTEAGESLMTGLKRQRS